MDYTWIEGNKEPEYDPRDELILSTTDDEYVEYNYPMGWY